MNTLDWFFYGKASTFEMFSHVKIGLICKQHLLLYTFHKIDIFFSYVLGLLNIVESPEGFILLL